MSEFEFFLFAIGVATGIAVASIYYRSSIEAARDRASRP